MNPYAAPQDPAYPGQPQPPGGASSDAQQQRARLLVPGIAIAVLGGLLFLIFTLDLVMAATGAFDEPSTMPPGMPPINMTAVLIGVCIFAMLLNAFVIFSMVQMLRMRTWWLALAGCIVAALPLSSSACCLLSLPFAIWAFVVLIKPEVKAAFR